MPGYMLANMMLAEMPGHMLATMMIEQEPINMTYWNNVDNLLTRREYFVYNCYWATLEDLWIHGFMGLKDLWIYGFMDGLGRFVDSRIHAFGGFAVSRFPGSLKVLFIY
jgi:hypothetical protein